MFVGVLMSRPAEVIDIPYTLDLFDMRDRLRSGLTYILGNASLLAAFADVFAMVTRWRGACRGEEETMSIKSIRIIQLATTAAPLHGTHKKDR